MCHVGAGVGVGVVGVGLGVVSHFQRCKQGWRATVIVTAPCKCVMFGDGVVVDVGGVGVVGGGGV